MFRFENPFAFWFFLVLPLLVLGAWWFYYRRQKQLQTFASSGLIPRLIKGYLPKRYYLKHGLLILSVALLIVALTNPQWSGKREKVQKQSAEIFILMDISNSMLAQDIKPNRMEKAKQFAMDLVDKLKGDKIGLILFAGNAYLQMPLTTDYAASQLFIKSADPSLAGTQGTAIGDAIRMATKHLTKDESGGSKGIVILTDGEDHEVDAIQAATEARELGIISYSVGLGTKEGSFIPEIRRGKLNYKRDNSGQLVRSVLNTELLKEVADAGQGSSYLMSNDYRSIIKDLTNSLDKLEKRELEQVSFRNFESYYQFFLFPALCLLFFEILIPLQKKQ